MRLLCIDSHSLIFRAHDRSCGYYSYLQLADPSTCIWSGKDAFAAAGHDLGRTLSLQKENESCENLTVMVDFAISRVDMVAVIFVRHFYVCFFLIFLTIAPGVETAWVM